jgi:hypothetical protein
MALLKCAAIIMNEREGPCAAKGHSHQSRRRPEQYGQHKEQSMPLLASGAGAKPERFADLWGHLVARS